MIKEILSAGGSGYLVPAVLLALVLYAMRGVFGLHDRRSRHRQEFLELWDSARSQDDLWLEVAVRHLFGTYLPARVIRLAMAAPHKSETLLDLAELWPLFHFDAASQTVRWRRWRHSTQKRRTAWRYALLTAYFVLPCIGALTVSVAIISTPGSFSAWIHWINALLLFTLAFICLQRESVMRIAASTGQEWLVRINQPQDPKMGTEVRARSL